MTKYRDTYHIAKQGYRYTHNVQYTCTLQNKQYISMYMYMYVRIHNV